MIYIYLIYVYLYMQILLSVCCVCVWFTLTDSFHYCTARLVFFVGSLIQCCIQIYGNGKIDSVVHTLAQ